MAVCGWSRGACASRGSAFAGTVSGEVRSTVRIWCKVYWVASWLLRSCRVGGASAHVLLACAPCMLQCFVVCCRVLQRVAVFENRRILCSLELCFCWRNVCKSQLYCLDMRYNTLRRDLTFFSRICACGGGSCVCVPRSAASAAKRLESQFRSSYLIYIVYVGYDIHTCDRVDTWYVIHWVLHTHMMYVYDIHCVYIYTNMI